LSAESALPRRISEFVGVALFALGLIWLIALVTHEPTDPVWFFTTNALQAPANFVGRVGAFMSELSFQLFGYAAYLVPALIAVIGWHYFWCQMPDAAYTKVSGVTLLFACVSAFLSLAFGATELGGKPFNAGGSIGAWLGSLLADYLNRTGSIIVLLTLMILSIILSTQFSFGRMFESASQNSRDLSARGLAAGSRPRLASLAAICRFRDLRTRGAGPGRLVRLACFRGPLEVLLDDLLALLFAELLLAPGAAVPGHHGPAVPRLPCSERQEPAERELRREDDRQEQQGQDQDDRAGAIEIDREQRREGIPHIAPRPERLAGNRERPEREREEGGHAREQEHGADDLGVRRVDGAAPEVVPAEQGEHQRDQVGGIAKELVRELGHEGPDPAGKVSRRDGRPRVEEPDRVGRTVRGERNEPDERKGEERDARKLTDTPG